MAKLVFQAEQVRALVNHSKGRKHKDTIYGQPIPGNPKEYLYFVHDDGIYLMAGAEERQMAEGAPPGCPKCVVAYAKGCDPKDEDCWEHCRDLVGGDDFAEPLPLDTFETALGQNQKLVVLSVTKSSIRVWGR